MQGFSKTLPDDQKVYFPVKNLDNSSSLTVLASSETFVKEFPHQH